MAIKFGSDGTLYCNSVRYNYKQARNIVYNNCGSHQTWNDGWSTTDVSISRSTSTGCFVFTKFAFTKGASNPIQRQGCFTPTAGHKYYGSILFANGSSSFSTGDARFEWWCNDTNLTGRLTFAYKTFGTNNNWVRLSSIQTAGSSMASGNWHIRNFFVSPSTTAYCTQLIIIDLTDTFGSGNEPTQAWCDANILEYKKLTGHSYDTVADGLYFVGTNTNSTHNWNSLNSNWEPRDRMVRLWSSSSYNQMGCIINKYLSFSSPSSIYDNYYASVEVCDLYKEGSTIRNQYFSGKIYEGLTFPQIDTSSISDYILSKYKPIPHHFMNGGGGMKNWRRVSGYNNFYLSLTGTYPWGFVFNNSSLEGCVVRFCSPCLIKGEKFAQYYNYLIGSTASSSKLMDSINKNTLDRLYDGRYNVIIHIKDPTKKYIKFNIPIQRVTRETTSITYSNANSWVGLTGDSWSKCTNTSELTTGLAYFDFTESTNNKKARFVVNITSISGTTINTDNYGWGYECSSQSNTIASNTTAWYQFCEGYDIECNDIEIHPEIDYISFDKTGTIKCKKLVTNF